MRKQRAFCPILSLDRLEQRSLLTGLLLQPDYFSTVLPGNAKEFPVVTVDVLANDGSPDLRVTSFSQPHNGRVELLAGLGEDGRDILQFSPGADFRGHDFFGYNAGNSQGEEAWMFVFINMSQSAETFKPWTIQTPLELMVTPGVANSLVDGEGKSLFSINYNGEETAKVGVYLQLSPVVFDSLGTFATTGSSPDATFTSQSNEYFGNVWIYGSIEGVNSLLAGLNFTPTENITAISDINLNFFSYIYSDLQIHVDSQSATIPVKSARSGDFTGSGLSAPLAVNDEFTVSGSVGSIELDCLANDSARSTTGNLQIIHVNSLSGTSGHARYESGTNRIIYQPQPGFTGTDVFRYIVANDNGRIAEAFLSVNVVPEMVAVGTTDLVRGTMIEIYNSQSGQLMREFKPFDGYSGGMMMESADMNGDGVKEIFAMQAGGENRMRVFDAMGNTMVDTVYQPFGNRRINGMDMEIGNIDSDKSAEMFFVASTSRGYELRVVDAATMQPQMTNVMRGMAGVPQLDFDQVNDQLMIMGRTRGGGVVMAAMTSNESGRTNISRNTMVSDRDMRRMTRRNGPVTDVALASIDQDGDGEMDDRMIQISFRNGMVQQMMLSDDGTVESSLTRQASADQPQIIMAALGLAMTPSGDMVWSDSTTDPSRRNRSRIVAVG